MDEHADFTWSFILDGKAVEAEDGDLIVEGYAANFDLDRDGEAFEPNSLTEGIKAYLASNPVLCYVHDRGKALGQVLEAKLEGKGMWIKARVDKPAPGSWAEDVVQKIKRGTIRGFSVGGRFFRHMTEKGPRIHSADIVEISMAPVPVNPGTLATVVGKAFTDSPQEHAAVLTTMAECLARLEGIFGTIADAYPKPPTPSA